MVLETVVVKKYYPFLDVSFTADINRGWTTILGLLTTVWRQEAVDQPVAAEDAVEWLQVVIDTPELSI